MFLVISLYFFVKSLFNLYLQQYHKSSRSINLLYRKFSIFTIFILFLSAQINFGSFVTKKKETRTWMMLKLMLISRDVTWSNSAKTQDAEANSLAKALTIPNIVEVNRVGVKT